MRNRIKEIRQSKGLSQEKLAQLVNTGKSQIVKLERGERRLSLEWIDRLTKALGCTPADLIEDWGQPGPARNTGLDVALMQAAMARVEADLADLKIQASAEERAGLASDVYSHVLAQRLADLLPTPEAEKAALHMASRITVATMPSLLKNRGWPR